MNNLKQFLEVTKLIQKVEELRLQKVNNSKQILKLLKIIKKKINGKNR